MMSCTTSATWSHPVSSPCYTEHGQRCGAVLSGYITTVAMSRSDQLGMHCTVELNCSDLFARLAGASVTHNHALDTCEPSCVPGAARPFFILVVHSPLGAVGYVTAPELSSRGGEAETHLDREARSRAEEHLTMLELSSRRGRARSHETRDSARAHLGREVRSGAAGHVAALELTSTERCDPKLQLT
jgi:hypothetical protein